MYKFRLLFIYTTIQLSIISCVDSTISSKLYSERQFNKINIGASKSEVIELLGQPLEIFKQTFKHIWIYETPNFQTSNSIEKGIIREYSFNLFGPSTRFYLNEYGQITGQNGDFIPKLNISGLTTETLIQKYGKPSRIEFQEEGEVYSFTKPPKSGYYNVRKILFDKNGMVKDIIKYYHTD